MILGMDFRPALLGGSGIGRVARELASRLGRREGVAAVRLFGHSLAHARMPLPALPPATILRRLPLPGRLLPLLARIGLGADRLCGGCDLFLWTDYVFPPLARARPAMILHDLAFLVEPAWHGAQAGLLAARTRLSVNKAALVLVPSPAVEDQARRLLPASADQLRRVPWGADHVPARPPQPAPQRPLFVALGTVEPRKGHDTLLAAFELLRRRVPDARLVVAGRPGWADPALLSELARRSRRKKSGLRWRRGLPDARLFALLAGATALVYPSRYEGFGLPVAEALALGIPPVTASGTAPCWVAGEAGCSFPAGDADALAGALERLARDRALQERLRARCVAEASRFRWDESADAVARHLVEARWS